MVWLTTIIWAAEVIDKPRSESGSLLFEKIMITVCRKRWEVLELVLVHVLTVLVFQQRTQFSVVTAT